MTDLTENDRRRLTDYLRECWHESCSSGSPLCLCGMSVQKHRTHKVKNRSFTTPDDMVALKDKMVEKGKWDEFYWWAANIGNKEGAYGSAERADWLIDAPRFCRLVNEWLKGKEDKP